MLRFGIILMFGVGGCTATELPSRSRSLALRAKRAVGPLGETKALRGVWHCEGLKSATPRTKAHKYKVDITIKNKLDGKWLSLDYRQHVSKANPRAMNALCLWGFDAKGTQRHKIWCMNSTGGHVAFTSRGWQGATMVHESSVSIMGKPVAFQRRFVRVGPDRLVVSSYLYLRGWWLRNRERCQRSRDGLRR